MPTDDPTPDPQGAPPAPPAGEPDLAAGQTDIPAAAPARRSRPVRRWILALRWPLLVGAVAAAVALTTASLRIAARFEARELEAPTRLYGRAVPLRPKTQLALEDVVARLERLGYTRTRGEPKLPGQFNASRSIAVSLRPFETARGPVKPRALRIRWSGRRISAVEDLATGEDVVDAVLPPEVVATLYGPVQEDRTVLPLDEFPPQLVDAVLVTEDKRFFHHSGVDPIGVARAALTNASSGAIKQGGSTLTQQLAKNLFFDQQRTFSRKAVEAVTAMLLEARYSKQRILQAYLNEVYLGQRGAVSIRGFAQAASFYFGKDVRALTLGEAATLAGLIRAPGLYNPFMHPERALERRNQVLAVLEKEGRITAEQREAAQKQPIKVTRERQATSTARAAAYLADYARQMIADGAGSDPSAIGLKIFTTIDPTLQRHAEDALGRGILNLERTYKRLRRRAVTDMLQGAIVVLDPHDGAVLAMVGGRDYAESQFNRVTQAHRAPGSLFKPFVYLAGYQAAVATTAEGWDEADELFTPATVLADEPLEMRVGGKQWTPANYDGEFRGPVTAQMALEQSLNVPTVRAALLIGLKSVVAVAKSAGVQAALKPYPSLALGAQEVTPLEIAGAYATIADAGMRHEPFMVQTVADLHGTRVYQRQVTLSAGVTPGRRNRSERALSAAATYLVTVGMEGVVDHGTGAAARAMGLRGTAAGKTGTTDDYRDAWFCGFTPDLLALVWIGFDDGTSLGLTGAAAALPIWVDFMQRAGAETSAEFPEPDGIGWEDIDPVSGLLARWGCPDARTVAFLEGTQPVTKCDQHSWFSKWW